MPTQADLIRIALDAGAQMRPPRPDLLRAYRITAFRAPTQKDHWISNGGTRVFLPFNGNEPGASIANGRRLIVRPKSEFEKKEEATHADTVTL